MAAWNEILLFFRFNWACVSECRVRLGRVCNLDEGKFGKTRYSEGGERRGKGRRLTKQWEPCTFDVLLERVNRQATHVFGVLAQGTGRETSVVIDRLQHERRKERGS